MTFSCTSTASTKGGLNAPLKKWTSASASRPRSTSGASLQELKSVAAWIQIPQSGPSTVTVEAPFHFETTKTFLSHDKELHHGFRPVPRAGRRIIRQHTHLRPHDRFVDRRG